ncbi:MAG: tRNA (adenosine(37)-N6)-threonylcarbamoyltransferase complex dimerization subunit type 1 TsaB [Steroidobacteraceae bacterium]
MKILAIDTATEACSAALALGGHVLSRYEEPGRGHAERILPMVDEILAEAGVTLASLDAIAFGRGPGAFTGVRIAAAVAQGLAFGAGLRVVAVSDLAALAARALKERPADAALICMDARMSEIYWCAYRAAADQGPQALREERVGPLADVAGGGVALSDRRWIGAGTGFGAYPELAAGLGLDPTSVDPALLPRAQEIAVIALRELAAGRALDPAAALPVYLRDKVVGTRP